MDYLSFKKELTNLYNSFNNNNLNEIDYILSEITGKNLLDIKFYNFNLKEINRAKKVAIKHLKTFKPIQKIFKSAYFYGSKFYVNNFVLTPRPDSEILVETALKYNFNNCLDLCSGSGCLGLSIKKNKPNINLTLSDISAKAIKISKINAKKLGVKAKFIKSNMFSKLKDKYDLIVCNPPYIETGVIKNLDKEVKNFDPLLSLDGGITGLKFYDIIYENLDNFLLKGGICLLEIGYNQASLINKFRQKFKNVCLIKDYNNLDRVIQIIKE